MLTLINPLITVYLSLIVLICCVVTRLRYGPTYDMVPNTLYFVCVKTVRYYRRLSYIKLPHRYDMYHIIAVVWQYTIHYLSTATYCYCYFYRYYCNLYSYKH